MPDLIATKSLSYATRRLLPGDEFTASNRDARILVAIGKAHAKRVPGQIDAPPASVINKAQQTQAADLGKEALNKLRAEYAELLGKRPFHGWDAAELQHRIDEALAS